MTRTGRFTFAASALLVCVAGCGGGGILSHDEEMLLIQEQYRRVGGTAAGIYANAKKVFDKLHIKLTGVREGAAMIGKMNIQKRSVFVYFKIAGGDWVDVRFYNLTESEQDKWRSRFFNELEAQIRGTPAERERSRRRQG
jgi:hypothetical protein